MRVCRGLLCVSLIVPTAAYAAKFNKPEANITATQTALTKPAQRIKEDKKRPDITAGDVFGGVGEQLKQVTDSQIKVLQKLIDNTNDDDPDKPDYYFRMAELFAEQNHYFNFRARELDAKIFEKQSQGKAADADKLKAQQADFEKREKEWLKAAVKEYLLVTQNPKFEHYKRMDQVLFYLAYLLTQQKREDLARPIFKRLIKDFPKSIYIPDAYLSFGEYFFEQKDMEHALQFYDKVLQFPESRVAGYAKYKTGWVYFNLQDFKKAMEVFAGVITESLKGKDKGKLQLVKEARKDLVRAYAQIAPPDRSWQFFQRYGGDYAPTMLEMLGELYNAQGKFDFSVSVYRQLIKLQPTSMKLCHWQTEILKNTLSRTGSRATPDSVQELQRLSAVYEKYRTMEGVKATDLDECRDNTAGSLRELATTWHKEAQKTGVKDTYDLAQYLYKEYITRFPKEKDIYPMTFYYGELLFKLEKFCDAAPIYADVVKLDPSNGAKNRNEAAYAAVISWKNCLNVNEDAAPEPIKKKEAKGKSKEGKEKDDKEAEKEALKPKDIPEKWLKMVEAFDTYIKYVPQSKELVNIKYNKAHLYWEYNHFAEAEPIFRDVVENHRESDLATYSLNLLFNCEDVLGNFDNLEADSNKFCTMPEFTKSADISKTCASIKNGISRKRIEKWEADGLYRKAADEYIKLANANKDDPRIAELYYNAAVDFEKAKAIGAAIQARTKLIAEKPDDPLAKKAVYLLGRAFQNVGVYELAADNYEKFAEKWPGERDPKDATKPDASVALYTASFFRRGLGDIDKSIADTNLFIKLYGGRKEYEDRAAGVYFELARIYEQQKNWDKVTHHLGSYLKTWGLKGGVDRQIIAQVKLGELRWKDSCPVAGVNGACVEVTRIRASSATRVAEKARKAHKGKKGKKKGVELPKQCGPETKSKIIVHERKPALVKEAHNHFSTALRLWAGGAAAKKVPGKDKTESDARTEAMIYHVAQARMMEGDQEYEKFLTMRIPEKLDFTPVDVAASKARQALQKKRLDENGKKFSDWLALKAKTIESAQKIYQQVILFKQAHWAIAAAARIGQLFQDFSGQLYTAPVPKAGKAPEGYSQDDFDAFFHDAYCDKMVDTAEPLEAKAIEGLSTCLKESTKLQWFNEWQELCEAELNQIKPAEYPLAAEIRAQPGYLDRKADAAPVLSEIK